MKNSISGSTGPELLEEKLGYHFKNTYLLKCALTHTSYANEQKHHELEDYERLEFLGDAVLEMISSAFLYRNYPDKREGELTKLRASLVCEQALSGCALELGLPAFLKLGRGEDAGGGRSKASILCDVVEALIGAMYLDSGEDISVPRAFIMKNLLSDIEDKQLFYDAKSILQEKLQKQGKTLTYQLISESGPPHERIFEVQALRSGEPISSGRGRSKKAAEQEAAYAALKAMK